MTDPLTTRPRDLARTLTPTPGKAPADPWIELRRFTDARIALGSVGASLPTAEVLDFSMAHARARDAVYFPFDVEALASSLEAADFSTLRVRSQATDRLQYLGRPDLGRRLDPASASALTSQIPAPPHRLTVVVADGLSALAATRHALPLLLELRSRLSNWTLDSVVLATGARVALADQIGELRGSEAVVILLGERPGLSSTDSLGIYLTYAPRPGRTEAERNCISNVRREGLSYAQAASKLLYLLDRSRLVGASGVLIKDGSDDGTMHWPLP